MLVELQRRHDEPDAGTSCWCPIRNAIVLPLSSVTNDGNGLIKTFQTAQSRPTSKGFAIVLAQAVSFKPETLRVVVYADFILDTKGRPLDGNHIGGKLPSGNGKPGDVFMSWFMVPGAS
jgi:hypothetical protein